MKPLAAMLNTFDFESVAMETMEPQGWGYDSNGGDDEVGAGVDELLLGSWPTGASAS